MADKLTKRAVDALTAGPSGDRFAWCGEVKGFGVRAKRSGAKTFIIQYRTGTGHTRRLALGSYGVLTVEQARNRAKTELARVLEGEDPSAARKALRAAMTVNELCDQYLEVAENGLLIHRGKTKKQSTLLNDRSRIKRHIRPIVGHLALQSVTRRHVEDLLARISRGDTAADQRTGKPRGRSRVRGGMGVAVKAVKLLSSMFEFARRSEIIEVNPCRGISLPADKKRSAYLTSDDYLRLGKALQEAASEGMPPQIIRCIRALALTGCRKSELLTLRPLDIDAPGRCLRLKDSKTGPQMRPCGEKALALLLQLENAEQEWVFPAARGTGHLVNLTKPLAHLAQKAGLDKLNAHLLRHSFATVAHELNYSELTIAGLLGHSVNSVTARYAHHVDHALALAANSVSEAIAARMAPAIETLTLTARAADRDATFVDLYADFRDSTEERMLSRKRH